MNTHMRVQNEALYWHSLNMSMNRLRDIGTDIRFDQKGEIYWPKGTFFWPKGWDLLERNEKCISISTFFWEGLSFFIQNLNTSEKVWEYSAFGGGECFLTKLNILLTFLGFCSYEKKKEQWTMHFPSVVHCPPSVVHRLSQAIAAKRKKMGTWNFAMLSGFFRRRHQNLKAIDWDIPEKELFFCA